MPNDQNEATTQPLLTEEYYDCNECPDPIDYEVITSEEVNAIREEESKNNISSEYKAVSYCVKPLLYGVKYGSKSVAVTSNITSTALNLTSSLIAGSSYITDAISKTFEPDTIKDKDSLKYGLTNFTHKLLVSMSSAIYGISYVPYFASYTLDVVSDTADYLDQSLTPETINEVCSSSNKMIKESIQSISSSLERVNVKCGYIKQGLA